MNNKIYTFPEAIDLASKVFYDLNGKAIRFLYRSLPDEFVMIFTVVNDADLCKALFPQFEILEDTRRERYAELRINYER